MKTGKQRGVFFVIEVDSKFSLGVDWMNSVKGVRLGFIAIHLVKATFANFVKAQMVAGLERGSIEKILKSA